MSGTNGREKISREKHPCRDTPSASDQGAGLGLSAAARTPHESGRNVHRGGPLGFRQPVVVGRPVL
jgi:hypothetical protein